MALVDLIGNFQQRQPNFVDTFNNARAQSAQIGLVNNRRQMQQQEIQKQSALQQLLANNATPQELARSGYIAEAKALSELTGGGKPFEGTSMDAQVMNILSTGDPSSVPYQQAYTYYMQPKTVMTQDGPMTIKPSLPPTIKPPVYDNQMQQNDSQAKNTREKYDTDQYLTPNQLKYNQGYNEAANLVDAYNRYMEVAEKVIPEDPSGWKDVTGDQLGSLRSAYGNLTLAAKGPALLELGVLSGPDLEQIEQIFPNPMSFKTNLFGKDYALSAVNEAGKNLQGRIGRINNAFSGGNVKTKEVPAIKSYQASGGQKNIPPVNKAGWRLHEDASGNKAYVSPDGQIEEVK